MGFTRYYERPNKPISDKQWNAFIEDVQKIFKHHADIICRESDAPDRKPVADDTEVRFNGKDGHDTFLLQRDFVRQPWRGEKDHFAFCKTARKPYDAVVACVLSCVKQHLKIFKVSSDGGEEDAIPPYEAVAATILSPKHT